MRFGKPGCGFSILQGRHDEAPGICIALPSSSLTAEVNTFENGGAMIRQPAVADRFYPGDRTALARALDRLLPSPRPSRRKQAIAAVSPHAGYVYSGSVAAETLSGVDIPPAVIILGLNHHGQGQPIALSLADWAMPGGKVPSNQGLAELLLEPPSPIVHDETAHRFEHSVEVQIPFLQALQPTLSIVPLVLSHISYSRCEEVAYALVAAIKRFSQPVLMLASSDMTHYESRESATAKDSQVLSKIEELNPRGMYDLVHNRRISMCGVIPVTVALLAAMQLGATNAEIVRYTDSGEVSGDTQQVVGYAGVVIS